MVRIAQEARPVNPGVITTWKETPDSGIEFGPESAVFDARRLVERSSEFFGKGYDNGELPDGIVAIQVGPNITTLHTLGLRLSIDGILNSPPEGLNMAEIPKGRIIFLLTPSIPESMVETRYVLNT